MSAWRPPLWYDRLSGIAWRAVIVVVAVALAVSGLVAMSAVILPVVLGLLFACGLHPVSERLGRLGVARGLSSAITILALVAAVATVAWLTVRAVIDEWDEITALLEAGRSSLVGAATDTGVDPSTANSVGDSMSVVVSSATGMLMSGLVQLVPTVALIITTSMLSFVVAFFFLKDGAAMWRWLLARLGGTARLTDRVGRRAWSTLSGFIVGQTAIAAVDATLIALGAVVLEVPHPGAIFMLTLFGAYIPFIGAFLSGLLAVLMALGDAGLSGGVAMLAVVAVVQVLEGNVLQPWIQGRAVRLHPLVIALAVTAGGALAGFLGVFLAVPVCAAGFVTLSELRRAGMIGPVPVPVPTAGNEVAVGAADSG